MSELLEHYDKKLLYRYYKSLKKTLNKHNNSKYNSYFEDILSEDNFTDTECSNTQSITQGNTESYTQSITQGNTESNTQSITQNITQSITQNITQSITNSETKNDDFYYKKPWNKLNIVHKRIKIKEFINTLMITKEKKKELYNKFSSLLNSKKLTKKNDVEYDSINGKIITIPVLKFKNEEYVI